MNMAEMEQIRHASERGTILMTLQQDYQSEMTAVKSLIRALDMQGISLSQDGVEFHLQYLAAQGYIALWRAREMAGFRTDRRQAGWVRPDTVMFAKLLPKGLQLVDGHIAADPLVSF